LAQADIQLESQTAANSSADGTPFRHHWALNLVGIATALTLCYYGEAVFVVIMASILLSFILAPVVDGLGYLKVPRSIGSIMALLLLMTVLAGIFYYSYNQASNLLQDLPKYAAHIRSEVGRFARQAQNLEVLSPQHEKGVVNVHPTTDWADILTHGFGSVTDIILSASFVPFLIYFMLTYQEHARSATVMLFPVRNRREAYVTLGQISAMIRSFMVGNLLIGLFMGGVGTAVFGFLHIPFFYFAGFASGFLSLIPYMGLLLAIVPPVFVGFGHINSQDFVTICITVLLLHLFALNFLYPKFLGNRLELNPLAVTIALLVWGGLWGAMGLVLAIPLTAAMKIVFDHIESLKPFGTWLGEEES
jgi:predicted PurR-regulated permease PerM